MHQACVCTQAGSSLVCTTLRLPGMAKVPTTAARWLCRMMPDLTWWCAVIILCTGMQESALSTFSLHALSLMPHAVGQRNPVTPALLLNTSALCVGR